MPAKHVIIQPWEGPEKGRTLRAEQTSEHLKCWRQTPKTEMVSHTARHRTIRHTMLYKITTDWLSGEVPLTFCLTSTEARLLIRGGGGGGGGGRESEGSTARTDPEDRRGPGPQTTTFEEKGEPKQIRTEVPLLTSLTPYHSVTHKNWLRYGRIVSRKKDFFFFFFLLNENNQRKKESFLFLFFTEWKQSSSLQHPMPVKGRLE